MSVQGIGVVQLQHSLELTSQVLVSLARDSMRVEKARQFLGETSSTPVARPQQHCSTVSLPLLGTFPHIGNAVVPLDSDVTDPLQPSSQRNSRHQTRMGQLGQRLSLESRVCCSCSCTVRLPPMLTSLRLSGSTELLLQQVVDVNDQFHQGLKT